MATRVIRAILVGQFLSGPRTQTTMHYTAEGDIATRDDATTVARKITETWGGFGFVLAKGWVASRIDLFHRRENEWVLLDTGLVDFAPAGIGDFLTTQTAMVVVLRGTKRRSHCRLYVPGLRETDADGGVLTGPILYYATNFLTGLLEPATNVGKRTWFPCVYSERRGVDLTVSGYFDTVLYSLRSRTIGRGR